MTLTEVSIEICLEAPALTELERNFGVYVRAVAADVLPREEREAVQQRDRLLHLMWGFGVWGLGFGVWGLGFGNWGLDFGGLGLEVWGPRFVFSGLGVLALNFE